MLTARQTGLYLKQNRQNTGKYPERYGFREEGKPGSLPLHIYNPNFNSRYMEKNGNRNRLANRML